MIHRIIIWITLLTFQCSLVSPLQAQILPAAELNMALAPVLNPALIKGMTIHPDNPLMFDFIIHPGDGHLQGEDFKNESQRLIKYFLASLTVPEKEMWVNLSPAEKDRIIPDAFGQTEMGRDLLAQDYVLKKLTSALISPDNETGKKMWENIYAQVKAQYGTTDIPMDVLSKVWIVPQSAKICESGPSVFVVDAHLKVLMESDYLDSGKWSVVSGQKDATLKQPMSTDHLPLITQILKNILLPAIEREVNNGPAFANLRQIYHSVILATWYKKHLKRSLLGRVYVDQEKTRGVSHDNPKATDEIYHQYLEAFQKGADAIKEEYDPATQEIITRKYISGGMDLAQLGEKVEGVGSQGLDQQLMESQRVEVQLERMIGRGTDTWVKMEVHSRPADELNDAAQLVSDIIEAVLAQHRKDPSIDQGRAVGKALGLPENLIPPGIRFNKAEGYRFAKPSKGMAVLENVVTHRLLGEMLNEIHIYFADKMEVSDLIHELGHYMNVFLNREDSISFMSMAIDQILKAEPETLPSTYIFKKPEIFQYLSSIRSKPGKIFEEGGDLELRQEVLNMISDEWARGLGYYLGQMGISDRHHAAIERYKIYQDHYRRLGIVQPVGWEARVTVNSEAEKYVNEQKRNRLKSSLMKTDSDAAATAETPGGIDLNPDHIQFDQQGQAVDFDFPTNDALIQEYLHVEGFEPMIINVTPITNIPQLLGKAPSTATLSSVHTGYE